MTITVVCDVLGEENNGTTIAAMNLIRHLKASGHCVRILCADQDKLGDENVFVVPNYDFGKMLNAYVKKVGVTLAKPQDDIINSALDGADFVHVMLPFGLGIRAIRIAKNKNLPVTAGFHMQAENFTSHLKLNNLTKLNRCVYKYIYNHAYKYVDAIHFPTEFIRQTFERSIKQKTRGYIISNGVHGYVKNRPAEKPREFADKIIILTTGRYSREKSQDTLLKAVKYSKHKNRIQLILAGQGVKEKYFKKLGKKLPIQPIFKFYSRNEIVDVLNYADLYVHTAEIELEGIACLEAVVCGKLTIVSDSPRSATKEFATDEKCVFKNRNPKSLAKVIDYWIDHPEERRLCEEKYLANSAEYNQQECMRKMEEMMFEVASEKAESKS